MIGISKIAIAALCLCVVKGFAPSPKTVSTKASSSSLNAIDQALITEMVNSRSAFGLYFFGSVGTAALGRSAIPVTLDRIKLNNALAEESKDNSKGGDDLGLGYPAPVFENDVREVLANPMTMTQIVDKYPIPGKVAGFLTYEAFAKANPDSNPMAVKAVWDAFAIGINTKVVAPFVAQEKFDSFKTDIGEIKTMLTYGKVIGVASFVILLMGLGVADGYAAYHGWKGWFPEWPGLTNFPASFVDANTGLLAIPKYYMWDMPTLPTP